MAVVVLFCLAMSDITIKIATAVDLSSIHEFLAEHFHNVEPIEVSHPIKNEKVQPDDEYLMMCIQCNTTLMAFSGEELVGILLAGRILPQEHERNLEASKTVRNEKHADVLRFLSYIDEKANYCNRLHVPEALHVHNIAISREFQGRGIAKALFKFCIENGRVLNYPALTVDCTSHYTAKIAEERSLSLISTVTYDEYNSFIGEKLFEPIEPHLEIKSYALLYKTSPD